jgi:hypothetical protein
MYNSRLANLPTVDVAPVWAVLKRLDAVGVYTFLINPATLSINRTTTVSTLTPLGQSKPQIAPQTQITAYSLPLLLISPAMNKDFTDDLALLNTFSTLSPTQTLPKLSFTFGNFNEPLCVITAFSYSIVQWRSGKPVSVSGSITIQPYSDIVKPVLFKEDVAVKPKVALSPREQAKIAEIMVKYDKTHKNVRVNGENVEGVSRKTNKTEILFSIKNAVRI